MHEVVRVEPSTVAPETEAVLLTEVATTAAAPVPTGLSEFDRAMGGGLVPGSVTLLGASRVY